MDERISSVQRMQDYIEAHSEEEITMAELSQAALFSPWYSYRIFKALTGITPSDYIRRLRLSKSAMLLKSPRICKRSRSYNSFRSLWSKNQRTAKGRFDYGKCKKRFYSTDTQPARKVIIKRGVKADEYFSYCEEVGCNVWETLMSMDSLCGEPVCLWLTEKYRKPGTSVYVQGVEVPENYNCAVPEGFDVISLPECDYLMFQGEPFKEEDYCEAINAVQQSEEKYDPSVIGFEWDSENPQIQLEPIG